MGSQLFYTYQSVNGLLSESESALAVDSYTYSLVFDTQRKTVWAQNQEYGVQRVTKSDNYDADYICRTGVKMLTYNGATSYMYVTKTGYMTMYNGCNALSMRGYDEGSGSYFKTTKPINVGTTIDLSEYGVEAKAFGSDIIFAQLYVGIYSQYNADTFNFPDTPVATVDMLSSQDYYSVDIDHNYRFTYELPDENVTLPIGYVLTCDLRVRDSIGNSDSVDMNMFIGRSIMFTGVRDFNGNVDNLPHHDVINFESRFTEREVESVIEDTIPATTNTEYFWMYIPEVHNVRMEQGGGIADTVIYQHLTINSIPGVYFNAYRTPRTNVGGAQYKLYIS